MRLMVVILGLLRLVLTSAFRQNWRERPVHIFGQPLSDLDPLKSIKFRCISIPFNATQQTGNPGRCKTTEERSIGNFKEIRYKDGSNDTKHEKNKNAWANPKLLIINLYLHQNPPSSNPKNYKSWTYNIPCQKSEGCQEHSRYVGLSPFDPPCFKFCLDAL